jgi:methionine-rich copper-binding protein CopC
MKLMKKSVLFLGIALAALITTTSAVLAHDMLTEGTVLTVAPTKLEIRAPNKANKKDETVAFVIDKNTKVTRGDKSVSYAHAKIEKGERIVVVVDTEAPKKMVGTQLRLQAK